MSRGLIMIIFIKSDPQQVRPEPNVEFCLPGGHVILDMHSMNREEECASILHSIVHLYRWSVDCFESNSCDIFEFQRSREAVPHLENAVTNRKWLTHLLAANQGDQNESATVEHLKSWQISKFSQWSFGFRWRLSRSTWGASASAVGLFWVLRSLAIISMLTMEANSWHKWIHLQNHLLLKYYI